jgi:hypothetical protein
MEIEIDDIAGKHVPWKLRALRIARKVNRILLDSLLLLAAMFFVVISLIKGSPQDIVFLAVAGGCLLLYKLEQIEKHYREGKDMLKNILRAGYQITISAKIDKPKEKKGE